MEFLLKPQMSLVIPMNIVIPTGDSLSPRERESEWRDLASSPLSKRKLRICLP